MCCMQHGQAGLHSVERQAALASRRNLGPLAPAGPRCAAREGLWPLPHVIEHCIVSLGARQACGVKHAAWQRAAHVDTAIAKAVLGGCMGKTRPAAWVGCNARSMGRLALHGMQCQHAA